LAERTTNTSDEGDEHQQGSSSPSTKESLPMLRCYIAVEIWLKSLGSVDEEGASSVEYALMAGLIAIGIIGMFTFFVKRVELSFNRVPTTWSSGEG
jgi:Flp pilus assembly pilin Flp